MTDTAMVPRRPEGRDPARPATTPPAMLLWPAQPQGAAAGTAAASGYPRDYPVPSFTLDKDAYASNTPLPAQFASLGPVQSSRGLSLVRLTFYGAAYNPAARTLKVVTSLNIDVAFGCADSGQVKFGTTALTNHANVPFEQYYASAVVNWRQVVADLGTVRPILVCPQMIIVTSQGLLPVARTFAADNNAQGISTVVASTAVVGNTATAVRSYILNVYNGCSGPNKVEPTYVTLIGNTSQVPTFELSLGNSPCGSNPNGCLNFFEDPIATDVPYGFLHQASQFDPSQDLSLSLQNFLPDMFVGRIPVAPGLTLRQSVNQARREVNTIINYENSYQPKGSVTGGEFFQPCPDLNCRLTSSASATINGAVVTSSVLFIPANAYTGDVIADSPDWGGSGSISDGTTIVAENPASTPAVVDGYNLPANSAELSASASVTSGAADSVAVYRDTPSAESNDGFCAGSETVGGEAEAFDGGLTFNRVANDEQAADPGLTINPQYCDWNANPTYMAAPAGINWNGGATAISAAVNSGTDLLWQIDHGNEGGWYQPDYGISDISTLTGFVPLVIGISCDTAKYDSPTSNLTNPDGDPFVYPWDAPSFGETWLEQGKAAAYIGSSREEPIAFSGFLLEGLGVALFDLREILSNGMVPVRGPGLGFVPPQPYLPVTVGQALATAKNSMQYSAGTNWAAGLIGTELEFNVLGDPSMGWNS